MHLNYVLSLAFDGQDGQGLQLIFSIKRATLSKK